MAHLLGCHLESERARVGELLAKLGLAPQKPLQRAYQRDPAAIERWQREQFPAIAQQAKASDGEVYFWDESGFRADAVHGRTWGKKGQTPVVERPGQRQSISAASAVNARSGFWYCTYQGGADCGAVCQPAAQDDATPLETCASGVGWSAGAQDGTGEGLRCLHRWHADAALSAWLCAPELNPDEQVWSHMKRTGVARSPLRRGERLRDKIEAQLAAIKRTPQLVRSFFKAPSVAYIGDW
jgi:hypothetical protein